MIAGVSDGHELPGGLGRWDDGKRRVIMVGRPTGQKGWDYAAAALASLSDSESPRASNSRSSEVWEPAKLGAAFHDGPATQLRCLIKTLSHMLAADLLLFPRRLDHLASSCLRRCLMAAVSIALQTRLALQT